MGFSNYGDGENHWVLGKFYDETQENIIPTMPFNSWNVYLAETNTFSFHSP